MSTPRPLARLTATTSRNALERVAEASPSVGGRGPEREAGVGEADRGEHRADPQREGGADVHAADAHEEHHERSPQQAEESEGGASCEVRRRGLAGHPQVGGGGERDPGPEG